MVSAYSIGTAKRGDPGTKQEGPSPNKYLPNVAPKQQAPQWTIGGQSKRQFRSTSIAPGPGAYSYQSKTIEGPQYSMKFRQQQKAVALSPGPGNYNNDESFSSIYQKVPSYTIGLKHHTSTKEYQPGPGQYDLNQSWISNSSIKFPTQPRVTTYASSNVPGPGQYDIQPGQKISLEKTQPSWGIGTAKRELDKSITDVPGPGTYKLKSLLNLSKNFTFKSRQDVKDLNSSQPGPGTYNSNFSILKAHMPTYKIGTELKSTKAANSRDPGPGAYYHNVDILTSLQKSAPAFKMPLAQRKGLSNSIDTTPGPGTYTIPKIVDYQSITMKGNRYNPNLFMGPGPGTYNTDDSMTKPKDGSTKIMGEHLKGGQRKERSPGPGQYSVKSTLEGPRWGFGSGDRSHIGSMHDSTPGPGTYTIPVKFNDVPKYLNCKPKYNF